MTHRYQRQTRSVRAARSHQQVHPVRVLLASVATSLPFRAVAPPTNRSPWVLSDSPTRVLGKARRLIPVVAALPPRRAGARSSVRAHAEEPATVVRRRNTILAPAAPR